MAKNWRKIWLNSSSQKIPYIIFVRIGLVVDLTYTNKYYHPLDVCKIGSDYYKLSIEGVELPDECFVQQLIRVIDLFNKFVKEGGNPDQFNISENDTPPQAETPLKQENPQKPENSPKPENPQKSDDSPTAENPKSETEGAETETPEKTPEELEKEKIELEKAKVELENKRALERKLEFKNSFL